MISPALLALPLDPILAEHPAAQRVYLHLLSKLTFGEHRPVKGWVMSDELFLKRATVIKSLNLLVDRGYLSEGSRGVNNVRQFALVWSLPHNGTVTLTPAATRMAG